MRDWNHNGKRDVIDRCIDYEIYKKAFAEKDSYQIQLDTRYHNIELSNYTQQDNSKYEFPKDDILGLYEIKNKSLEEILRLQIDRKKKMDNMFEFLSIESGFREVFDNRQMGQDIWLYGFGRLLDGSNLTEKQKIQVLQLLLDTFLKDYLISAQVHYEQIKTNTKYKAYMEKCFGLGINGVVFWILLGTMGGNNGERAEENIGYTKEYVKFMVQLEIYMSIVFEGREFGGKIQNYLLGMMELTSKRIRGDISDSFRDISTLYNPLVNE